MTRVRIFCGCLIATILMFAAGARGQDYDTAIETIKRGDVETGVRDLTALSDRGHVMASLILGAMYRVGEKVSQDPTKAARFFKVAAEGGDHNAQFFLAEVYLSGRGVAQDLVEAHRWGSLAAGQGSESGRGIRETIEALMTVEQVKRSYELIDAWIAKKFPYGIVLIDDRPVAEYKVDCDAVWTQLAESAAFVRDIETEEEAGAVTRASAQKWASLFFVYYGDFEQAFRDRHVRGPALLQIFDHKCGTK